MLLPNMKTLVQINFIAINEVRRELGKFVLWKLFVRLPIVPLLPLGLLLIVPALSVAHQQK